MLGAIVGDIVGSVHERRRNAIKTPDFPQKRVLGADALSVDSIPWNDDNEHKVQSSVCLERTRHSV
jgi:ADP-ribosylglycohydrolase